MDIRFINCNSPDFEKVLSIRNTVFEKEQGAIAAEELDSYDSLLSTEYALIYDGACAVATGRIAHTEQGVKIGRIAVLRSCRGKGVGKMLVNALCTRAEEGGADKILVDSQLHAVGFYQGMGFKKLTDKTIIDRGIVHLPMIRENNE